MQSAHLLVGGEGVCPAEIATTRRERARGLLGRDRLDGVLVLPGVGSVHTLGMRFTIDVAFARWDGARKHAETTASILEIVSMKPNRLGRPRRCDLVLEAEVGRFSAWSLAPCTAFTFDPSPNAWL